jgi:hypothetical protein
VTAGIDEAPGYLHGARLARLRIQYERAHAIERASTPRQEPLPFGDGWLDADQEEIEFHGTNIGLRLHAEQDETPCAPCSGFLGELLDAGLARRMERSHT